MTNLTLSANVSDLPLIGPSYQKKLEKLGILTIEDLLTHIPHRYLDFSKTVKISQIKAGEIVTVSGIVNSFRNQFTKTGKRMQIGLIEDETGKLTVLWFNQPYLIRALYPGAEISLSGEVSWFAGKPALISPEFEIKKKGIPTTHTGKITGVYSETKGLSSKWLRSRVKMALSKLGPEKLEYLAKNILNKYSLVNYGQALADIHFPKNEGDYLKAKRRLAFNELLSLQLDSLEKKKKWQKNTSAYRLQTTADSLKKFTHSLPFDLTDSQNKVIDEILSDFKKGYPMHRLLQGDVGSGKTIVAATAIYMSYLAGFKSLLMAPTQILANQHFNELKNVFTKTNIKIDLVTANTKKINKNADIYIGTHALINRGGAFEKVAFVVIDEQHKFGVEQREKLLKRETIPHVLTMTATPIPRTVALTLYGDQELSILSEIPKGRQKIVTWLVPEEKRGGAYKWIDQQLTIYSQQLYWICPLIEESEAETLKDVKAVKTEYLKLKTVFPELKLGLLHGRMKEKEKNDILNKFKDRKLDMLVTTPVVEVGIDIPNATIMIIEAADRFGLAQLHQLRGRVGRGEKKSYCLLFSDKPTPRLEAMTKTHSGFELSELDLKLRGPGEVFGLKQSGLSNLKIASWTDAKLIKQTREAVKLMVND